MSIQLLDRTLHKDNIDHTIVKYKNLILNIPLQIEGANFIELMQKLKRNKIDTGPYPHVSVFEAANRIMTDLVILFGVRKLLFDSDIQNLKAFEIFEVEFGNENRNAHDVISRVDGKYLAGEAFNVAPSFFAGKNPRALENCCQAYQCLTILSFFVMRIPIKPPRKQLDILLT